MTGSISSPSSPALPAYAGTRPAGCVYTDAKVDIPPEAVDLKFIGAFEYFVGVIAALERALKGSEPQRVSLLRHRPNGVRGGTRVCRQAPPTGGILSPVSTA